MVDDQKQRHRHPNPEEQVEKFVHRHSPTPNTLPRPANQIEKTAVPPSGLCFYAFTCLKASVDERFTKVKSRNFRRLIFMLTAALDRNLWRIAYLLAGFIQTNFRNR